MSRGTTISLYLVEGNPSGIVCAYLSNWTGQAIRIPRNLLDKAKQRPECNRIGVYLLFGYSDEMPDEKIVYIGETDNIYERLVQHAKDEGKSFWTEAIGFTSKDDNLNKGHIKYLEYKLIKLANENTNYTVHNGNNSSKPSLSEMSVDDVEAYLDNLKIVLPALGYDLISELSVEKKSKKNKIYNLELSGIKAKGISTNNGFVVLKGSELTSTVKDSLSIGYKNKRGNLIVKGILKEKDGKIFFDKDYEFSSPSAAAAIIVGYAVNGRRFWQDEKGKSLKENEEIALKG